MSSDRKSAYHMTGRQALVQENGTVGVAIESGERRMDSTTPDLTTALYVAALIGVIASAGTTITKKVLKQLKVRGKLGRNGWQIVCLTTPIFIGVLLGLVWRSYGLPGVWGPAVGAAAGAQATTIYAAVRQWTKHFAK